MTVLLAELNCFGMYVRSPSILVAIRGPRGEDESDSFINGSETGAAVLDECM